MNNEIKLKLCFTGETAKEFHSILLKNKQIKHFQTFDSSNENLISFHLTFIDSFSLWSFALNYFHTKKDFEEIETPF